MIGKLSKWSFHPDKKNSIYLGIQLGQNRIVICLKQLGDHFFAEVGINLSTKNKKNSEFKEHDGVSFVIYLTKPAELNLVVHGPFSSDFIECENSLWWWSYLKKSWCFNDLFCSIIELKATYETLGQIHHPHQQRCHKYLGFLGRETSRSGRLDILEGSLAWRKPMLHRNEKHHCESRFSWWPFWGYVSSAAKRNLNF